MAAPIALFSCAGCSQPIRHVSVVPYTECSGASGYFRDAGVATPRDHSPNWLAFPVLIEIAGTSASGFQISDDGFSYLVSAAHVLFKEKLEVYPQPAKITVLDVDTHRPVEYELNFQTLYRNNCLVKHPDADVDVAVCRISRFAPTADADGRFSEVPMDGVTELTPLDENSVQGLSLKAVRCLDQVRLCESILLLAHPTSLTRGDRALSFGYPLMRSGIVAGTPPSKRIIIDCPTYPGNSGGLVFRASDQTAIGVAVRNISFTEKLFSSVDRAEVSLRRHNSGYTVVEPMDRVLETIEEIKKLSSASG